jgi:hypothetical protein
MDRRAYLAAVGSLSAGCVGGALDSQAPPPREVRWAHISPPEDTLFEIDVAVTRSAITSEQTASLEFEVTWSGDETIRLARQIPFGGSPKFSDSPKGLLLYHTEALPVRRTSTTWIPNSVGSNQAYGSQPISSGQSISTIWQVWANPEHMSSIQPGDYRFNHRIGTENSTESSPWSATISIQQK